MIRSLLLFFVFLKKKKKKGEDVSRYANFSQNGVFTKKHKQAFQHESCVVTNNIYQGDNFHRTRNKTLMFLYLHYENGK